MAGVDVEPVRPANGGSVPGGRGGRCELLDPIKRDARVAIRQVHFSQRGCVADEQGQRTARRVAQARVVHPQLPEAGQNSAGRTAHQTVDELGGVRVAKGGAAGAREVQRQQRCSTLIWPRGAGRAATCRPDGLTACRVGSACPLCGMERRQHRQYIRGAIGRTRPLAAAQIDHVWRHAAQKAVEADEARVGFELECLAVVVGDGTLARTHHHTERAAAGSVTTTFTRTVTVIASPTVAAAARTVDATIFTRTARTTAAEARGASANTPKPGAPGPCGAPSTEHRSDNREEVGVARNQHDGVGLGGRRKGAGGAVDAAGHVHVGGALGAAAALCGREGESVTGGEEVGMEARLAVSCPEGRVGGR